jgi:hypothetical protein
MRFGSYFWLPLAIACANTQVTADGSARRTDSFVDGSTVASMPEAQQGASYYDAPHNLELVTPSLSPGTVDVASQIEGSRAGIGSCYRQGLNKDPKLQGKATYTINLNSVGDVLLVTEKPGTTISSEVASCVQRKLKFVCYTPQSTKVFDVTWVFTPPKS